MSHKFSVKTLAQKQVAGIYLYQWVGWLITILVILAAAYFKVELPALPPVP